MAAIHNVSERFVATVGWMKAKPAMTVTVTIGTRARTVVWRRAAATAFCVVMKSNVMMQTR